jgi:hypothetical protein
MTAKELMIPRFEVTAEYPSSIYEVGQEVIASTEYMVAFFTKYPHIFRKMNWWEKRSAEQIFSVGNKVYFTNEKLPYKVMAVSERYAVVSRPLNRREDAELLHHQVEMGAYLTLSEAFEHNKQTPVYSLIDFKENVRAPDNLVFGFYDYSKESDCEKVIKALENCELELSHRTRCELSIDFDRSFK